MVVLVNRAKMTTSTTGTGTITLGSVVDGYQTFAAAGVSNGDSVRYVIEDGTSNWEIGSGTYTASGTTLSRTPSESSGGGSAINLSGDAIVFISAIASDLQPVTYVSTTFTATAAQTAFTVSYTAGLVEVFLNGAKLSGADFTATNGTSVVLASGANVGDTVDVVAYGTVSVSNTYTQAQANALFVDVAGDTMTGDLNITGTLTSDGLTVNPTTSAEISGAVSGGYVLKLDNTHATSGNGLRIETPSTASNEYSLVVKSNNGSNDNLVVANNGDISFYEDTGTTPKFFWDASAESLGIGTTSPDGIFEATGGRSYIRGSNENFSLGVGRGGQTSNYFLGATASSSPDLLFSNNSGTANVTFTHGGNVGIGTSSPSSQDTSANNFVIHDTAGNGGLTIVTPTNAVGGIHFSDGTSGADRYRGIISYSHSENSMRFHTDTARAMTIDSSGNLLVGTTSTGAASGGSGVSGININASGAIEVARSANPVMFVNRTTSDGDIMQFRKDGSTVGSIGTSGVDLTIGTGDVGLKFNDASNRIDPWNVSTNASTDGAVDLGKTDRRFKDLHLSGTAYDGAGNLRAIPQSGSDKTSSYTLVVGDVGNFIGIGSGGSITVPNSTFATGDAVSVFNNTSGDRTITLSITTAYIAGEDADKSSVTLATRGVCTILFISSTVCVISGTVS